MATAGIGARAGEPHRRTARGVRGARIDVAAGRESDELSSAPPPKPDVRQLLAANAGTVRSVLRRGDGGFRSRAVDGLQRAVGNSAVQRLVGSAAGPVPPVQRYAVGVRRSAGCPQVVDWLNTRSPHRPAWAKTTPRFTWTGPVEVTGSAPDFQVSVAGPRVTVHTTVDMPRWNPADPAMAAAWRAMSSTLRAHEAEHEAIGDRWRQTLHERLTNLALTVTARGRAAARRAAEAAVQVEWRSWLVEHQNDQNAIDPFTAVLDCPAPSGGQASP